MLITVKEIFDSWCAAVPLTKVPFFHVMFMSFKPKTFQVLTVVFKSLVPIDMPLEDNIFFNKLFFVRPSVFTIPKFLHFLFCLHSLFCSFLAVLWQISSINNKSWSFLIIAQFIPALLLFVFFMTQFIIIIGNIRDRLHTWWSLVTILHCWLFSSKSTRPKYSP